MYTDNYNDEQENVVQEVTYDNGGGNNTLKIIIIVIMLIVIIGLVYYLLKGKTGSKNDNNYVVTIAPETIVIPFGKNQNVSYEVRNNGIIVSDAAVRIVSSDEKIIQVNDTILTGVDYGKTSITATYVDDKGGNHDCIKEVTVADGNPNTPLNNVVFPTGDLQMPLNGTYNIRLTLEPSNGYVENKKITSSNESIVLVDNTGLVTAVSEGEAVITIDINNGKFTNELKVIVGDNSEISKLVITPTDIKINNPIEKMTVGDKASLKYSVTPSNASTDTIKWTSSNESVLSVDYRGNLTAIKEGSATIKVEASSTVNDIITVQVEKKVTLVDSIDLTVTDLNLTIGNSEIVVPVVNPADATDKTLTYEVDNPTIVGITPSSDTSSVTVSALQAGTATITIKANSSDATKIINVMVVDGTSEVDPPSGGGVSSCGSCSKVTCASGKYCSCGKCLDCPAGNYCSSGKKVACPAGKGSVTNSSSPSDCTYCAKGYYSTGNGKGCVACPTGKTTKSSGSTSKNDCSVNESGTCKSGEYLDGSTCKACPSGYTSNGGKISKSSCYKSVSAGQYLKTVGGSSTTACPAGSYSGGKTVYYGNTSSCTDCAKGYYQNKTGQSSCVKCPAGKTTSGTGSKNSNACNVDATASPKCLAGQYKDSSGNCKSCPSGYTSSAGSTSINKCYKTVPAGSGMIGGTIYKCPANMYSSSSRKVYYGNDSRCTSCPSGSSTNGRTGQTECTYG